MMRNLKLILEYDGSKFFGFQKQTARRTLQEVLESALSRLFAGPTKIKSASGRTDAGVHAERQVVNFLTHSPLKCEKILKGLNFYLPKSMAVKEVKEVPATFHARFNAKSKVYEYRVWNHPVRSPLRAGFSYHVPGKLDLKKMRQAAKLFVGRHDFRNFCSSNRVEKKKSAKHRSPVRALKRLNIKQEGSLLRFQIEADGFLYHMVRNIVGALLEIGKGRLSREVLRETFNPRVKRSSLIWTAPACGLVLKNVIYRSH